MAKRATPTSSSTAAAAQAALASLATDAAPTTTPAVLTAPPAAAEDPALRRVPLLQILPSVLNPRRTFDEEGIRELASSIEAQGLLQNLVVRPDEEKGDLYRIVAGERRWRALDLMAKEARLPIDIRDRGVPVRVIQADAAQHLALALLENLQRIDVNPMEEAAAFAQLQQLDPAKWTTKAIAEAIGKPKGQRFVQQRLALVERLAPEVQAALREGKLTFTHARHLTMADFKKQKDLLKKGAATWSADRLKEAITGDMVPVSRAIFPEASYDGKIVENAETGTRYFADKKLFMELQRTAATAKAAELKKVWAWTELQEGYSFSHHNYEQVEDDTAGAVVHFSTYTGIVEVHKGLVKRRHHDTDPAEAERRRIEQEQHAAIQAACDRLRADLQPLIAADPAMALRLFFYQIGASHSHKAPVHELPADGLMKHLVNGGPLSKLASHVDSAKSWSGRHNFKDDATPQAVWGAILQTPPEKLTEALAMMIANGFNVAHWREGGLSPLVVALARHYQVAIPEILQPAQIDIEDAVNAAAASEAPSVGCRVRAVLAKIGGYPANAVVLDREELEADCGIGPEEAVELGEALAEEFGFARPPFVVDPDAGTGLAEIGFATVGDLVAFLEKRLAATEAAAE